LSSGRPVWCSVEGNYFGQWRFYDENTGTYTYSYAYSNTDGDENWYDTMSSSVYPRGRLLYNVNWDARQIDCECKGKTWFSTLGAVVGSNNWCCGDDLLNDDFATYSGSLTSSILVTCRRCLNGLDEGSDLLVGNGNFIGDPMQPNDPTIAKSGTCSYGDITCTSSTATSGASQKHYGNGYTAGSLTTSTSLTCYYGDITCADNSHANGATATLYGNGYLSGSGTSRSCYYGDITCADSSYVHGASATIYGWGWYDGSLTTSTSLSCRSGAGSCTNGGYSSDSISTLYGNGYLSGSGTTRTCYYGDITCSSGSESHGSSATIYGWGWYNGSLTTSLSVSCRSGAGSCTNGAHSSDSISTLYGNGYKSGTTCYYGDIACSSGSESHGSSCTLTNSGDSCVVDVGCLNQPTGLTATALDKPLNSMVGKVELSWTDNSNIESGYKIERSVDGTSWSEIDSVGASVTTYIDDNLEDNFMYYYRVRAYYSISYSTYSNIASTSTKDRTGPSNPNIEVAADNLNNKMDLSWDWSQDEKQINIKETFNQYFTETVVNGNDGWECTGISPNNFYFRNQILDSDIANGDWTTALSPYFTTSNGYTIEVKIDVNDYAGMRFYFGDGYYIYIGYGRMDLFDKDGILGTVSITEEYDFRQVEIVVSGNEISATIYNVANTNSWTVTGSSSYSKKGRIKISYENSGGVDDLFVLDNTVSVWHFDEGSGSTTKDASGTAGTANIYGATWTNGVYGDALEFDGTSGDYVDIPDTGKLAKFSLEAYIYNVAGGDSRHSILRNFWEVAGTSICFWSYDFANTYWRCSSSGVMPYNEWTHIVTTWDGSVIRHYANGELVWQDSTVSSGTSQNFYQIAGYSGRAFKGKIDNLKIYNRTLTQEEIQTRASYGIYRADSLSEEYSSLKGTLRFESAGYDSSNYVDLIVEGIDLGDNQRGHNIVHLDSSGNYIGKAYFDTCGNDDYSLETGGTQTCTNCASDQMATYLNNIPSGHILIMGIKDYGGNINNNALNALQNLGSEYSDDVQAGGRSSWGIISVVGEGKKVERYAPQYEGPVKGEWSYYSSNFYSDTTATDNSEPEEATDLTSTSHSTSNWDNDNTVDFSWNDAIDNGDDYFYYLKSFDIFGNQNYFTRYNVITNTDLDGGWSKGYTQNIQWNDIEAPMGLNTPVVSFENDDTSGSGYWYSYGNYAPQEDATTYTVSLWVKTNQASDVRIRFYTADNSESDRYTSEYRTVRASEGWKLIVWDSFTTANPTDSDSLSFNYLNLYDGGYTRLWMTAPQMEASSFPTFINFDTIITGLSGYDISCNQNSGDISSTTKDINSSIESYTCTFPDGNNNYFHLKSVDNAGNWDTSSNDIGPFFIDTVKPITNINSPAESSWQNNNFAVSISDSDERSGLNKCYYKVTSYDGSSWVETRSITERSCGASTTLTVGNGDDCRNVGQNRCKIEAWSTDNAGNIATHKTRMFNIAWCPTLTGSYFSVDTSLDKCFRIDENGNARLKGTFTENCASPAPANSFVVKNSLGDVAFWVNSNCNMCLRGILVFEESISLAGNDGFYIKKDSGNYLFKADPLTGNLIFKEHLGFGCSIS
jgi:hypothetical protein